jgi:electron transport complex protein RnfC
MLEEGERVIEGLKILLHIFPEAKGIIGVEDNKKDAYENLRALAKGEERIEVILLQTKYPQGSEKHLIHALTGREVQSGKLPADAGCIVQNIDTIVAIWRAVIKGRPLMRRIVTVTGDGVKNPCNVKVRLGMSYREILEYAGFDPEKTVKVISGGPMMGQAISSIDIPVVKGTSAILCLTKDEVSDSKVQNCIRCGKCVENCPISLIPNLMHHASLIEDDKEFLRYHGMDCIECGCCSFVCPSKRHLVQTFRTAKNRIRAAQSKK